MASRSMGRTSSAVGMMEGAFFVSRSELLQWVNELLELSLTKVEQCANACVYCQVVDSCYPGSVAMKKLNWMARAEHEYIPNYKVLQAAFDKNSIEKHIEVEKLTRGKYQDNLEFLQWMKCFWDREGSGRQGYDPVQAREGKPLPAWARALEAAGPARDAPARAAPAAERRVNKENLRPSTASREGAAKKTVASGGPRTPRTSLTASVSADRALERENSELRGQVELQQEELKELRGTLDGLERERDYYFTKLRDVEILCTTLQAHMNPELTPAKLIENVQGILYAEQADEEAAPA